MRQQQVAMLVLLCLLPGVWLFGADNDGPLTFEERVRAQEAVERVYYEHRIWPKENPGPKPPFEELMPREILEAKVTDHMKKSSALEAFWQRPVTGEQLQAEMDRMARQTRDAATLRELFEALGNDPRLIAECLARPALADRLIRHWYANDSRFHAESRCEAEDMQLTLTACDLKSALSDGFIRVIYTVGDEGQSSPGMAGEEELSSPETVSVTTEELRTLKTEYGEPAFGPRLTERRECFEVAMVTNSADGRLELLLRAFPKRPFTEWWDVQRERLYVEDRADSPGDPGYRIPRIAPLATGKSDGWLPMGGNCPVARYNHKAVWTGSEMIVWGGTSGSHWYEDSGGRYNPAVDLWFPTSKSPLGKRFFHTAVWTGTEMIVWGGLDCGFWSCAKNGGACYDPLTDTWRATSTGSGCPSERAAHSAVWTGSEMIVWGGYDDTSCLDDGGRYDPSNDTWRPIAIDGETPLGRWNHSAVWTGTEMIVWGGCRWQSYTLWENSGGRYNPSSDSWRATSTGAVCPSGREDHSAVWTGDEMIVWGGGPFTSTCEKTGGRYDPSSDSWRETSTGPGCPTERRWHSAVWTGAGMIIFGGWANNTSLYSGATYDPSGDSWTFISTGGNHPSGRNKHSAVWTGTEMIVWGGSPYTNTGGRYSPSADSWVPTAVGASAPSARKEHTAVWTGAEMIVWGGGKFSTSDMTKTGGRYTPATFSWTPTSTDSPCPDERKGHTAVWTGDRMIVWGGFGEGSTVYFNSGGLYDPAADGWTGTSTGTGCPAARRYHTAVWTGTEMIVWGGADNSDRMNTGARYNALGDSWVPTSTGSGCPTARNDHTAVWTGDRMIVWGGYAGSNQNTGAVYTPLDDAWNPTSTGTDCPPGRTRHTAVWTGAEMAVWGGYGGYSYSRLDTGGLYDPGVDAWRPTSTEAGCPEPRDYHTAVWTGGEMVVWGGEYASSSSAALNSGGRYAPASDTWIPISTGTYCPSKRYDHTAVWTGSEMIVWGGYDGSDYFDNGSHYTPPAPPCTLICSASAAPETGPFPLVVEFTGEAAASHCSGEPAFAWNFGDGFSSSEQNPAHTYASEGIFTWTLTVTADGESCVQTGTIAVTVPDCTLTCSASGPAEAYTGVPQPFTGSAQTMYCSGSPTFAWTFGDGSSSTQQNPIHTYESPGTFTWTLRAAVEDKECTQSGTVTVTIPVCTVTCQGTAQPTCGAVPFTVSFTGSASTEYCSGQPVYLWDFGDGGSSTQQNPTHTYETVGTYNWALTVTVDDADCTQTGKVVAAQDGSGCLPGDCDGNGTVSIGEVQKVIRMHLRLDPPGCGADCDGSGTISIGELQKVINAHLRLPASC